jgi:putative transposase
MKNKRYSDAQIMGILKQAEGGVPVSELCREHGMSNASFYKWRAKFGGMDASMISELKAMAEENRRLKRMGDAEVNTIPVSPEGIDALLDVWPLFEAFQTKYVAKGLMLDAEKNASASLPSGFSAGVTDTVRPARKPARTARRS